MKHVILSADNELKAYLVPDFIAESRKSFNRICMDFSMNWKERLLRPQNWFNEKDFIEYLNEKVCKEEKCVFVENLGWNYNKKKWPEKYQKCYRWNF